MNTTKNNKFEKFEQLENVNKLTNEQMESINGGWTGTGDLEWEDIGGYLDHLVDEWNDFWG